MKIGLTQLETGENAFESSSDAVGWAQELVHGLSHRGTQLRQCQAHLHLTKLEPDYYLKGALDFQLEQVCCRCAETFLMPVHHDFEMGLAHGPSEESNDLDIQYFQGPELDLGPILEEQVLLSLPFAPLCRPDCKGICQQCGTDLNKGQCQCKKGQAPKSH